MNFEKEYKNVFEHAKSAYGTGAYDDYTLEQLFPQLKESEDEKIRKFLIEELEALNTVSELRFRIPEPTRSECIAYLEKQKTLTEHGEGVYHYHKDGSFTFIGCPTINGSTTENLYDVVMNQQVEKQKEQKVDIDKLRRDLYQSGYNDGYQHGKEDAQKEQKPVEWDDYTETNLDRALLIIKNAKGNLQGYQSDDGIYECDKAIECIEHILYRGINIEAEWVENNYPKDIEKDATQFCFDKGINITPSQAKQIATHYLMIGHNNGYIEGRKNAPITEVMGFKVGDVVRLKDGDGRHHVIKSFEKVAGIHGSDFYRVEFEDDSARDHIFPDDYPNHTQMVKI